MQNQPIAQIDPILSGHDVTLAILAGGAGSRMGRPKGSLHIGNQPIIEYLIGRFAWPGPTMLVIAPGIDQPPGAHFVDRVVSDPVAGAGPLRGILTALQQAATERVVVATVDMPGIASAQLLWILKQLIDRPDVLGILNARTANGQQQIEPFPSAYRKLAGPIIAEQLAQRRRAVHSLSELAGFLAIPAPVAWQEWTWTNLNTPEDVERFKAAFAKSV